MRKKPFGVDRVDGDRHRDVRQERRYGDAKT
jgi:hypothetical protein